VINHFLRLRILSIVISYLILSGCTHHTVNHNQQNASFIAIPLGTNGGLNEANLSSYLIAPAGSTNFIAFDAGTLLAGLKKAQKYGSLRNITVPTNISLSTERFVLQEHIKAYAISHGHLDHIAGMVINATNDNSKKILGLTSTIEHIKNNIFNWQIWPNFGDEGDGYNLQKYQYTRLKLKEELQVNNTEMAITPFELSHSKHYISTAFLIRTANKYLLYFGDVGPDNIENSQGIQHVWQTIAPYIRKNKLKGIFIEASFPSSHPDHLLFGHLTPKWLMKELRKLATLVNPNNPKHALKGLKVVVTHIKPSLNIEGENERIIMNELALLNDLNVEFILPQQGKELTF
jgi:3',5'-cyclic-nucleotide phosphodiesterase